MLNSLKYRKTRNGILSMCENCGYDCKHAVPDGAFWAVYCRKIDMTEYRRGDITDKSKGHGRT